MSSISVQMRQKNAYRSIEQIEDQGITVRSPSTSLLLVDSKDRYRDFVAASTGTTSPYKFSIYKAQSILNGFFHRIALTEIVFPFALSNITDENQSIQVTYQVYSNPGPVPGPVLTQTITPFTNKDFKTPVQIASALQTALQAIAGLNTSTVGYNNGYFVIFPNNNAPATDFVRISFQRDPALPPTAYQLFDFLNMNLDNTILEQTQETGYTRCRWTEYVDIVCSQLTYNQDVKDASTSYVSQDVLARIYLEDEDDKIIPVYDSVAQSVIMPVDIEVPGTYPTVIYRKFPVPKMIQWNNEQPIGNLQFEVYDDKGRILSFHNILIDDYKAPNWRMTLQVSEN